MGASAGIAWTFANPLVAAGRYPWTLQIGAGGIHRRYDDPDPTINAFQVEVDRTFWGRAAVIIPVNDTLAMVPQVEIRDPGVELRDQQIRRLLRSRRFAEEVLMRGMMSRRLSTLLLTSASVAALSLAWMPSKALADKVGVAAAVHPDAFSGADRVTTGSTIFYNQRINTSGSGLVQVLLVDGSTFTVGPGSDLVIDKFVYDPKKNSGQVVATLGKVCCASSAARSPRTKEG